MLRGVSSGSITLPLTPSQQASFDNGTALLLPKWRAAIGKVKAGTGNCRILCVGDSITIGFGANGASSGMQKNLAWPGQLSKMLNSSGVNSHYNSIVGNQDSVYGSSASSFDTRISVGSGWGTDSGIHTIGGNLFANTTTTNPLSFTPAVPVDTFIIYYAKNTGLGTFSYDIDGGTATNISTNVADSFGSTTISTSLGIHTCNLKRVSGGCYIIGWEAYDSSKNWVSVVNAGVSGWSAVEWNYNGNGNNTGAGGNTWGTINAISAIAPDLTFIFLGVNDWLHSSDTPAQFYTNIQNIITAGSVTGDCVLVSPAPSLPGGGSYNAPALSVQRQYVAQLSARAVASNVVYIDINSRWVDEPTSSALYYDAEVHPKGNGYADIAQAIFNVIGNV